MDLQRRQVANQPTKSGGSTKNKRIVVKKQLRELVNLRHKIHRSRSTTSTTQSSEPRRALGACPLQAAFVGSLAKQKDKRIPHANSMQSSNKRNKGCPGKSKSFGERPSISEESEVAVDCNIDIGARGSG